MTNFIENIIIIKCLKFESNALEFYLIIIVIRVKGISSHLNYNLIFHYNNN